MSPCQSNRNGVRVFLGSLARRPARRDRRRRREGPDPRGRPLPAAGPPPRQGQSRGPARQHPAEGLPQTPVHPRPPVSGPRPLLPPTPPPPPPPHPPPPPPHPSPT